MMMKRWQNDSHEIDSVQLMQMTNSMLQNGWKQPRFAFSTHETNPQG